MQLDRNFYRDAGVAAPLAFHQGAHRAKAGLCALQRNWLIEHEVCSHFEGAFQGRLAVNNRYCNSAVVNWRRACPLQDLRSQFSATAVDDHCLEPLTSKFLNCAVCVQTMLNPNF